jgi:hypothetical protein
VVSAPSLAGGAKAFADGFAKGMQQGAAMRSQEVDDEMRRLEMIERRRRLVGGELERLQMRRKAGADVARFIAFGRR